MPHCGAAYVAGLCSVEALCHTVELHIQLVYVALRPYATLWSCIQSRSIQRLCLCSVVSVISHVIVRRPHCTCMAGLLYPSASARLCNGLAKRFCRCKTKTTKTPVIQLSLVYSPSLFHCLPALDEQDQYSSMFCKAVNVNCSLCYFSCAVGRSWGSPVSLLCLSVCPSSIPGGTSCHQSLSPSIYQSSIHTLYWQYLVTRFVGQSALFPSL